MASLGEGELRVQLEPASSSRETQEAPRHVDFGSESGCDAEDDGIWGDASDSPDHASSTLDREWIHRQNQFHKMGYRDGIAEAQKDSAQEGFNVGFRQSAHVGYKWGLVHGVSSVLVSLPDSLKEKVLPNVRCRGELQNLHKCVQEISADDAFQMFHGGICQNDRPSGEAHATLGEYGATYSNRLANLSKGVVLLLHECPDVKNSEIGWPCTACLRHPMVVHWTSSSQLTQPMAASISNIHTDAKPRTIRCRCDLMVDANSSSSGLVRHSFAPFLSTITY